MLPLEHRQRHIKQCEHNEALLQESCFPDPCKQREMEYKDWAATVTFYAAFHYVEGYLHAKGLRTDFINHRERNDYLKTTASAKDSAVAKTVDKYIALYKFCCLARYRPCHFHYIQPKDLCKYVRFSFDELRRILVYK